MFLSQIIGLAENPIRYLVRGWHAAIALDIVRAISSGFERLFPAYCLRSIAA